MKSLKRPAQQGRQPILYYKGNAKYEGDLEMLIQFPAKLKF